jgi:hypothetical protein
MALEEVSGFDIERRRQLIEHLDARGKFAPLKRAYISAINASAMRKLFLGHACIIPALPQILR